MAKKKRSPKKDLLAIDRGEKRAQQVAQGAMDGRFRVKVAKSKKRYVRKPVRKNDPDLE